MISCPTVSKRHIRGHYDLTTVFYRLLWGEHIHHGLWSADETPRVAQLRLTETLAAEAGITGNEDVLDVGCGMGGSSLWLAARGCRVTGVTISGLQRRWAALAARRRGLHHRTRFVRADAEALELTPQSVDVVWSIECTEHLFDKAAFFQRAAGWLRPGGRVAICAWLAGDAQDCETVKHVERVCEGFFCPSLGTAADYTSWMQRAGLRVERELDWTKRVERTWEICQQRVARAGMPLLARCLGRRTSLFVNRFETILSAYRSGAMRYGCFIARRNVV